MVGAKRSAHRGDGNLRLAVAPDERNDFLPKVGIEDGLNVAAMEGMGALVVKAQAIDGIDAIKLDATGVDEVCERANQSLAFEFPFIAGAGRKAKNRRTPMAINDNAEFDAESMRIPAMIVALHERAFRAIPDGIAAGESMPAEIAEGNGSRFCESADCAYK